MTKHAPSETVMHWLTQFDEALTKERVDMVAQLFTEDGYWRDLLTFTWNLKTLEGRDAIVAMLRQCLAQVRPSQWTLESASVGKQGVIEGWLAFETTIARGKGHVRLKGDQCWTLLTTMTELKGFEEKKGPTRELGLSHGTVHKRQSWIERRTQEEIELGHDQQPYCVIIGGGQGGIALGARLKRLDVPTIILDKHERPGDAWRKRYQSLCLHDPVWYDHLPYLPFPDHWPVFSPKDKIADWLETYTKIMELNYWPSSECKKAHYDEQKKIWTVQVERAGKTVALHPRQLIFATGMSGIPNLPTFPGMENFIGTQHHSSQHPGGAQFAGKKCVIIGSNNSAHDIAADLWEHGADVTMVQRSTTLVVKSESLMELSMGPLYSEQAVKSGTTTEMADMIFASIPYKIMPDFHRAIAQQIAEQDADFYHQLDNTGFMRDWGDDGSGLMMKYLRRGSGYYIDVGASALIIDGKIKLKSGVTVAKIKKTSLVLSDGSELEADLIVYATGYHSMNGWVEQLVSKEMATKVGKCWGLGSNTTKDPGPWEGELRNMWKPTQQEGLWFHGGNLHQSRFYSLHLALQLKALKEGIKVDAYEIGQAYHER